MIAARDLSLRYASGVQALLDVNLQVGRGQFTSIVGPSGCGKSTLLRLVAGLVPPSTGQLQVLGHAPAAARRQQELAYVFQEATLLPWRSVAANVALPLELRGEADAARVASALDTVGLTDFAHALPRELSGGMRMRASIARALVTEPQLLLLDEPFGALDDITRGRLNLELLRLWENHRWTALFVTHNVQEAVFLSQRVLVMSSRPGRLVADVAMPWTSPRAESLRLEPAFAHLVAEVTAQLREYA
jgi:NitT/TauT family transport system ATP-binding protein